MFAYREGHDASASGRHEGLGDFEQAAPAPAQLLPLLAPKLAVEALCYVARQFYVLLLVRACSKSMQHVRCVTLWILSGFKMGHIKACRMCSRQYTLPASLQPQMSG